MIEISLTKEEKHSLESRHKSSSDSRECDRIKVVLLRSEGWSYSLIAQALRIDKTTVKRHFDDYQSQEKLKPENGGSVSRLTPEQTEFLIAHLTKFTFAHTHQIVSYIDETFGVKFTVAGLNKWLHRNGFSYKKPKGVPHKFDEQKQAEFKEKYETLKAEKPDNEPIVFMDAVHPTMATKLSYGWIKRGEDKLINTTGSRTRLNIIGGIQLGKSAETVTAQYERVNQESVVDFLVKLKAQHSKAERIHLILDGAAYHRAGSVKEKAKELKIELHYLPPYSPNLTPIERLWKVMNEHVRNNEYFASAKEFRKRINHFFDVKLPEIADTLTSRITDNFQTLTSAT